MAKNDPNSFVNKAEGAVESLFFTYTTEEKKEIDPERKQESNIVTIDTSKNTLASGLELHAGGESDRRLSFDKDSLALQALQEGKVDFADKRVAIKDASVDINLRARKGTSHQLLEVDLGELKSLRSNQIHIDELLANSPDG